MGLQRTSFAQCVFGGLLLLPCTTMRSNEQTGMYMTNRATDKIKCIRVISQSTNTSRPHHALRFRARKSIMRGTLRLHDSALLQRHREFQQELAKPDHTEAIDRLRKSAII